MHLGGMGKNVQVRVGSTGLKLTRMVRARVLDLGLLVYRCYSEAIKVERLTWKGIQREQSQGQNSRTPLKV